MSISSNIVTKNGAGAYITGDATLNILGAELSSNQAGANGGALNAGFKAFLSVNGMLADGNEAGARFLLCPKFTMRRSNSRLSSSRVRSQVNLAAWPTLTRRLTSKDSATPTARGIEPCAAASPI